MARTSSSVNDTPDSTRHPRPRTSLRVRNVAEGVVYHLVFEGDVQRLSGRQLRHHLAQICHIPPADQQLLVRGTPFPAQALGAAVGLRQEDTVDLLVSHQEAPRQQTTTAAAAAAVDARHGMNGSPLPREHRGYSAATASSLRPSTDAGTLSPEAATTATATSIPHDVEPWANRKDAAPSLSPAQAPGSVQEYEQRVPSQDSRARNGPQAPSTGSTATSSTRIAPSPERLVEQSRVQQPQRRPPLATTGSARAAEAYRPSTSGDAAYSARAPPPPPPSQLLQDQPQTYPPQQLQRHPYEDRRHDDSQVPLWTSATTLSSFPAGRYDDDGEGESPRPHFPSRSERTTAAASNHADDARRASLSHAKAAKPSFARATQQPPPQPPQSRLQRSSLPSAERAPLDPSASDLFHSQNGYHRPSYEVPSPYEQQRQRQDGRHRQARPQGQMLYGDGDEHDSASYANAEYADPYAFHPEQTLYGGRDGLNQSRIERAPNGGRGSSASRSRRASSPQGAAPVYASADAAAFSPPSYPPHQPTQHRSLVLPPAQPRAIPIRADDLEMLLDEQDYIWQMEEYRFRTERLNRLTALQNRQRELTFEATRYDQAVAVVSSQLQRERRKLAELQAAMSHHTTSLNKASQRGTNEEYPRRRQRAMTSRGEERNFDADSAEEDVSEVIEVDI